MRNKVKRTLSFLLTFVMLCSLLPAMALAKEPEGRYEEVAGTEALVADAEVHVYSTKGAGDIELTGTNSIETTFTQGIGYREYTATAKEGWVFDTWEYEQLFTPAFGKEKNLGNRTDEGDGTRYSFTNSGDNWHDPYTKENATISVNRLLTTGETVFNKLYYNIYANFNPTIKATAEENGTISGSDKPVEVEYGKDQAFDIKADTGYIIDTITVDGKDIAEGKNEESYTYTFENVIVPHTIDVTFRVKPDPGQCIVSYVVQGDIPADYQAPEADIVKEGETYTVKSVPEPVVDYKFSGWYDEDQNIVTEFTVTGDVTLTGIWTYTGEKDLWDTVYGTIRVYMDEGTEADFDNLPGFNLNKQVRLYSEKYLTDGYRLCGYEPINDFWYTTNAKDVTARDISEIVLAKDKLVGSSEKISIPMTGNDDYQVTVSEGEDKFGLIPYTYLKIEISKKEPVEGTVMLTYDANGGTGAPANEQVEKGKTATLNNTIKPTHVPKDGRDVEFKGWRADEAVINQVYEKDNVPTTVTTIDIAEENVTVYAVWAYGDPVDPTTPEEKLPVFLYVLNQTDGETTDDPADYSYLATGAKVKAGTSMETPYTGEDAQNQIASWNVGELGNHDGYAEVSSTPVGAESTWEMDENGNVTKFSFQIGDKTYTNADYDFTWQKLSYIDASYKENKDDTEWKPAFHLDGVLKKKPEVRTVEVKFVVDIQKGEFTEYGVGPVVFNIKENSSEKYLIPQITPNDGYEFTGWKILGNAEVSDGSLPKEMTEFELANVNKQIQYNGNEGSVTIEAMFSKKPVEKTLRIHWAIDNPEGAAWKLYEGNARTETIAWADRGNTFVMPELEIKDGYKLAGWSVSGTEDQYWDPETYEFGLTGLIVEDENGGQVSITANVVKDEEPVEKTLRIHWAIDNPEGAAWKLYEGNARTETIAWADRGNTFVMPELEIKDGYKLAGWSVSGTEDQYWDPETYEFGLTGLIVEDENGGQVSITANVVKDEEPVEKTLRIHWAIDNPEGAAWKLYEGNARTETIAWADRGNTFVMPELEIKDGYKLAGWSVSGTEGQYWDPETYEFGLTGLIAEDENGGQVSITANVVKDEEPAGKTLRIHWAIDNPEGAAWKLYEGNARTETIAWADRGNTFVMPELEIKDGYKLAGWSVSGTEGQYWDPETYEFGLTGLIVEDENGGQVSITANVVKDEEPAGKTLRIHWAIDNPEGAAWKLYEGNARTETIAWADRGNTFVMPELEIKDGYKLAGWSVSGTEGQYWDPETYEFGLTGLIVEDENGGQVSITANVVKDEEPAGKTLRIHWAIDNPEGAVWKLYEGNARTETIAWADRGNTFVMPELEIKDGYKLAGWSVSGTEGQYWDPETYEFGLTGLIVEDENGGQVSITANVVKDEEPAGKTLRIHWAIDNPEGAAWKLYEGNARTETIAWADRGNTFVMPELEIKDGYKLAGWSVSGTEGQYWDPETYEFGLTGLIVEDENGGQVSITANVVKDEEPTEDKIANVYFTVNPKYGYFKEYGEGPVSFENIDADSTQQFEVPEVVAKSGYKFVGWEGKGAGEIKWDANASTFGVPGLCYFPEGSNVGRADIRAVFEKEGGGHINDYAVTVIVDGKGEVKTKDYGTVGSNDTDVIWIPDFEDSVKFTMEPADGWKIDDVLVNGKSIGAEDSYVFETEDLMDGPELKVIFEKKSSGGGGGGSHDKDDDKDKDKAPDKTPDALNGEDHFNYIVGDADGKVHLERNITRAEVASIFFRLLKDDVRSENLTDQNTFADVSADDWFNVAVSTMYDMDIVYGRDNNNFDPNAYITRAEFAAIAARFDSEGYSGENLFTDIDGHWAANQINRAAEKGWISGYPDGTFGPDRYITRAEAVTMINRVLNRLPESADALHEDMNVFPDNMDTTAWYYLAIQEATSSHEYEKDKDGVYETWTDVLPDRDWAQYLKLN